MRLENKNKKALAVIKRKKEVVATNVAATKKHNTSSSSTTSTTTTTSTTMMSASEYVIQPVSPHSDISSSVSSVIPPLVSSLPSTSYDAELKRQTFSSQEKPDLDTEDCKCSFCYEPYRKDGKEWLESAWVGGYTSTAWRTSLSTMVKNRFVHFALIIFLFHSVLSFFHELC